MTVYHLEQIETPRLIIRPVELRDETPLNEAINHSLEILKEWMPWAKDPSIEATRGFIQRGVFAWKSHSINDFPMVIIHKADKKIIGASSYSEWTDTDRELYDIGYWCDVNYQGRGFITESVNALTRYAFEHLQANRVTIMMQVENKKSRAVAQRLGFTNNGITTRNLKNSAPLNSGRHIIYSARNTGTLPPLNYSHEHTTSNQTDAKIIEWSRETLNITDHKVFANSQVIISTPWSMVATINTGKEQFFLKHTPPALALESQIIQLLHDHYQANVPEIIKHNANLHCFLMKDAGKPLRGILKQQFDTALYCKAIREFTSLQIATSENIPAFIDCGVPDWRLNQLPDVYMQLLTHENNLITDGLSKDEVVELKTLLPTFKSLCHKLANYEIEPSIVQPDFHDNNILIDERTRAITFIDLGEIVLSHPFFSLTNCLYQAKRHHGLADTDTAYQQLEDACLDHFRIFASKKGLLEALQLAQQLEPVYQALSYHRLMYACDKKNIHAFYGYGRLSRPLKQFMSICNQIQKQ